MKSSNRKVLLFASIFLFMFINVSCASAPIRLVKLGDLPIWITPSKIPNQKDYPEDNAVVLHNEIRSDIDIDDRRFFTRYSVHEVIKVFKNPEQFFHQTIEINEDEELDYISARTIDVDGTITDLSYKDVFVWESITVSAEKKNKTKLIKFNFPNVRKGALLEFKIGKIVYGVTINDTWMIGGDIPVKNNVYSMKIPNSLLAQISWKYKAYNFPNMPKPYDETDADYTGYKYFSWTVNDVPATKREPNSGFFKKYVPRLRIVVSGIKDWNDFSVWYYNNYFKKQFIISGAVSKKAKELVKEANTVIQKIEAIYKFVSDLEYSADHVFFGYALKPNTPETVLERGYGDCKDKSILLSAMLESIGITTYPVLVKTKDTGEIDPDFPDNVFNHMIIKAFTSNSSALWLDATLKDWPLGAIPYNYDGTQALVIIPNGKSILQKLPEANFGNNRITNYSKITINPDMTQKYDVKISYSGIKNLEIRELFKNFSAKEMVKFCRSLMEVKFLNSPLENIRHSSLDRDTGQFELSFSFSSSNPLIKKGDNYLVSTNAARDSLVFNTGLFLSETRTHPIEFGAPYSVSYITEINFPSDKLKLSYLPVNTELAMSGKEVEYKENAVDKGQGRVEFTSLFSINSRNISEKKFTEMKGFFQEMAIKGSGNIFLADNVQSAVK